MPDIFNHPWLGGLYHDGEMEALWSAETQLASMLAFEAAWSRTLGALGLFDAEAAETAARAIETMTPELSALREGTARDGVVIPALVTQMKAAAGAAGKAVHSGATSQDVIDSALAISIRESLALVDSRLAALDAAIADLETRFGDQPLMGRTRMQAAVPITVRDRIEPWRLPLGHHRSRISELGPRVALVQIGGAAGDRAALGAQAEAVVTGVARALNLGTSARAWHAMRDGVAEFASLLSLITGTLGKIGQDICLMAQQGLSEIAMAGGGGSSAMAHKQNPVAAELLVTLARFNAVQVSALHQALVHEQERSGAAWGLEWMVLPQMAATTGRALAVATELCRSVTRIGTPD